MAKKDAKPAEKANKPKKPVAKPAANAADEGFSAGAFAQGTREELAKVIWPTRQQLISESAAVILMVGLSATLIYLVDKLFGWASRQVF
ncbi:MAG: preprotein translocase subunit SecE [Cyanobacteria bacterium J06623_5]